MEKKTFSFYSQKLFYFFIIVLLFVFFSCLGSLISRWDHTCLIFLGLVFLFFGFSLFLFFKFHFGEKTFLIVYSSRFCLIAFFPALVSFVLLGFDQIHFRSDGPSSLFSLALVSYSLTLFILYDVYLNKSGFLSMPRFSFKKMRPIFQKTGHMNKKYSKIVVTLFSVFIFMEEFFCVSCVFFSNNNRLSACGDYLFQESNCSLNQSFVEASSFSNPEDSIVASRHFQDFCYSNHLLYSPVSVSNEVQSTIILDSEKENVNLLSFYTFSSSFNEKGYKNDSNNLTYFNTSISAPDGYYGIILSQSSAQAFLPSATSSDPLELVSKKGVLSLNFGGSVIQKPVFISGIVSDEAGDGLVYQTLFQSFVLIDKRFLSVVPATFVRLFVPFPNNRSYCREEMYFLKNDSSMKNRSFAAYSFSAKWEENDRGSDLLSASLYPDLLNVSLFCCFEASFVIFSFFILISGALILPRFEIDLNARDFVFLFSYPFILLFCFYFCLFITNLFYKPFLFSNSQLIVGFVASFICFFAPLLYRLAERTQKNRSGQC
jgi:hypothetical protein